MKRFLLVVVFFLILTVVPCSAEELTEAGNNNTLKTAETFSVGDSMTAQLSDESDIDCFKFEVPFEGTIHFTFQPLEQNKAIYSSSWILTVYEPDMKTELLSGSLSGRETIQFDVENAKPGMHYLKFERISGGNPLTNGYSDQKFIISAKVSCAIHTYTDWTILKEATPIQEGLRERSCIRCGTLISEPYYHPVYDYLNKHDALAMAVVALIVAIIIFILVLIFKLFRKLGTKHHTYYHHSSTNSSSYSSGSSYSKSYGSSNYSGGYSYDYGGSSSYTSTISDDGPINYGYAYDYNSATNTYTNADGGTMTLEPGYIVGDDGAIHLDVSDM